MGCVHPGRASDGEEYSDAASDDWDRGVVDDPAARHQGANGAAAHRDANGTARAPGDGAHLVAGAGSRPGSADSAHLLSATAAESPGAAAARAAAEAAEVGPQVDPEPLVAGMKHHLRLVYVLSRVITAWQAHLLLQPVGCARGSVWQLWEGLLSLESKPCERETRACKSTGDSMLKVCLVLCGALAVLTPGNLAAPS